MKQLMNKLTFFKSKTSDNTTDTNRSLDELKWQFALENSNVGLWDWNAKTNKVFYSEKTKQLIGYNNSEIKNSEISMEQSCPSRG